MGLNHCNEFLFRKYETGQPSAPDRCVTQMHAMEGVGIVLGLWKKLQKINPEIDSTSYEVAKPLRQSAYLPTPDRSKRLKTQALSLGLLG
jgi:hypothetical protein